MNLLTRLLNRLLKAVVDITLFLLNFAYGYTFRRFFVLETIARIPYFSYLSVLHLHESLGKHPTYELMNLHFHESVNEEYHLLIMEELGGGDRWLDRTFARTLGVAYYWINCALYLIFPRSGYYLMELVETYATLSYTEFLKLKEDELKSVEASKLCREYYFSAHSRMTLPPKETKNLSLFDVFEAIRQDEMVHVEDMKTCASMESLVTNNPGTELKLNQ